MEAFKFGFGENMPPSFKFDPTDADIVGRYLLPRALGLPNPHTHAIIEGDDPGSAPPCELLERHGHHHQAFFFGPPQNVGRQARTLKDGRGVWLGQKGHEDTVTLLHPDGGEADVTYKRYNLCFALKKSGPCTGYVMDEYTVLEPPLPGTVLTRIRHKIQKNAKRQRVTGEYAANQQHADPVPEQPGPSYDYEHDAAANGVYGFAGAQEGALCDSSSGGGGGGYHYPPLQYDLPVCDYESNYGVSIPDQPGPSYETDAAVNGHGFAGAQEGAPCDCNDGGGGYHYPPLQYDLPVCDYESNYGVSIPDQPDPSYDHDAAANGHGFTGAQEGALYDGSNGGRGYHYPPLQYDLPVCDYESNYGVSIPDQPGTSYNYNEEGFTDAQTDAFYGGACHDPSNYAPECGSEYSHYYAEHCQPSQYEQGPSNQYQAGDAAVMWAGDERFIGEYCQPSQYEQDPSNQYQAGDAAVMYGAGDERFSGVYCQRSQYEHDPSNQYQAGDAAVMCAGDERFIGEEEANIVMCADDERFVGEEEAAAVMGAGDEGFIGEEEACGNSDKGSITGTDTTARSTISTISLCGDMEDDTTFLDTVIGIGDGDDLKCEQNDAGDPTNE